MPNQDERPNLAEQAALAERALAGSFTVRYQQSDFIPEGEAVVIREGDNFRVISRAPEMQSDVLVNCVARFLLAGEEASRRKELRLSIEKMFPVIATPWDVKVPTV